MQNGYVTRRLIRFAELKSEGVSTNAALRAAALRTHNYDWVLSHPVVVETLAALNATESEDRSNA